MLSRIVPYKALEKNSEIIYLELIKNIFTFLGTYLGKPADYCFMLIFNCLCCVILGLLGEVYVSTYLFSMNFNFYYYI